MIKFILFLLIASFLCLHSSYASVCSDKQCYVDAYESANSSELPEIVRVNKIYDRLRSVVGTKETISSELLVIESNGRPWALSLPDQTIIITTGAIKIFYNEGDYDLGDARAAFVLGHELAHIITQDFFHAKAFNGENNNNQNMEAFNEEMRADTNGFTYASIAGYSTQRLLTGKDDFFIYWAKQLPLVEGLKHPKTLVRSENIQQAFNDILDDIPFYRLGLVLAHAGNYKDAANILTDYLKNGGAKTKELYINLGYTHLQLAREEMPEKEAYKYWIPTLLEVESSILVRSMFGGNAGEEALRHLNKAEEYLQIALDMDENDYPTLVNLTAVYLYMPRSIHKAYAAIKSAIDLNVDSANISRQLLSIYHLVRLADDYDGGDRWTATKSWFQEEIADYEVDDNIIYNMARMLDDRGRDDAAKSYWSMLLERRGNLPKVYREHTCVRLNMSTKDCHSGISQSALKPWPASHIPVGIDVREKQAQECLQEHWKSKFMERSVGETSIKIYTDKQSNEVIAIDNLIEVYLKRDIRLASEFGTVDRISSQFGDFISSQPTGTNDLALYKFRGASALVHNDYVRELWITDLSAKYDESHACN